MQFNACSALRTMDFLKTSGNISLDEIRNLIRKRSNIWRYEDYLQIDIPSGVLIIKQKNNEIIFDYIDVSLNRKSASIKLSDPNSNLLYSFYQSVTQ